MGIIRTILRFFGIPEYDEEKILHYPASKETEIVASPEVVEFANKPLDTRPQAHKTETKLSIVRPELTRYGRINFSLSVYTENLKEGYILLVDVSKVVTQSREEARKIIHFLSGVTEALGGVRKEVVPNLFLFAPPGVQVHGSYDRDEES